MSKHVLASLALVTFTTTGLNVQADDQVDAQALFEQNCTSCHGSEVYTREDRRVNSLDALHSQVRMCEQNLDLTWFDDQVDAVTTLLNRKYYKFEP